VVLVAGPLGVPAPPGVRLVRVETTAEMHDAVATEIGAADALIMAAAPSDFRPTRAAPSKIKKNAAPSAIELEATPDILAATRSRRQHGMVVVGFALETDSAVENARVKLAAKGLDLVVVNVAGEEGAGFEVDTNRVSLLSRHGLEELPLSSKSDVADAILDRVEGLLRGRES
jgi:phosphopantothenoylcysteine decarboxylase/phosphopantothenate--cysteine ligase